MKLNPYQSIEPPDLSTTAYQAVWEDATRWVIEKIWSKFERRIKLHLLTNNAQKANALIEEAGAIDELADYAVQFAEQQFQIQQAAQPKVVNIGKAVGCDFTENNAL